MIVMVMIFHYLLWCNLLGLLRAEFDQLSRVLWHGGWCGPTADRSTEVALVSVRGGETHRRLLAQVRLMVQMMVHTTAGVLRGHLL